MFGTNRALTAEERRKKAEEEAERARALNPRERPSSEIAPDGPLKQALYNEMSNQFNKALNPPPRRTLRDKNGVQRYVDDGSEVFKPMGGQQAAALSPVNPEDIQGRLTKAYNEKPNMTNATTVANSGQIKSDASDFGYGDTGNLGNSMGSKVEGDFGQAASNVTKPMQTNKYTTAELHKKTNEEMNKKEEETQPPGSGPQENQPNQTEQFNKRKTDAVDTSKIGARDPLGPTGTDIFTSPQITPDRLTGPITEAGTAQLEALGMNPGNLTGSALQAEMGQVLAKEGLLAGTAPITGVASTMPGALAAGSAAAPALATASTIAPALATASTIAPAMAAASKAPLMMASDERLKENITKIGKLESGLNLYRWAWNDKAKSIGINSETNMTVGVIAQEALEVIPEAVMKYDDGYYRVDYSVILGQ